MPWGPIMGLLFGMACGALFASIHALATVTFKVDHIVSGVVINLVAVGLARFLSTLFFGQATQSNPGQPHLNSHRHPRALEPAVGPGRARSRNMSPMVHRGVALGVPRRPTRSTERGGACGSVRAGENPEATRSLGVRVAPIRYQGVMLSGALAGLSGAFLAVEVERSLAARGRRSASGSSRSPR